MNFPSKEEVFIANPKSNMKIGEFSAIATSICEFCSQTFETDSEKNFHMLEHFAFEICNNCDKRLIRIGDALYVLHTAVTCVKTVENPAESHVTPVPVESFTIHEIIVKEEHEEQLDNFNVSQTTQFLDDVDMTTEVSNEIANKISIESVQFKQSKVEKPKALSSAEKRQKYRLEYDKVLIKCDYKGCDEWIRKRQKFNHMRMHRRRECKDFLLCEMCNASFRYKHEIEKHMRIHAVDAIRNDPTINLGDKLPIPLESFTRNEQAKLRRSINRNALFKCKLVGCNRWYKKRNKWFHMTFYHSEPLTCDLCDESFSNLSKMRTHIRKHAADVIQSGSATVLGRNLTIPKENPEGPLLLDDQVTCEIVGCGERINRKSMDEHIKHFHGIYTCDICNLPLASAHGLRTHKLTHNSERKRFDCQTCGKTYLKQQTLKMHVLRIHANVPRKYMCTECGYECDDSTNLEAHIRIHTGERPFICSQCNKTFRSKNTLDGHAQSHTDERVKCKLCDTILKKGSLRKHEQRVHSNLPKNCICNICGQGFLDSYVLKEHMRVHTGERPFACSQCEKTFRIKALLDSHMRVHTGEKPYKCDQNGCDRAYSHLTDLRRHKYGAHGIWSKKFTCEICKKDLPERKLLRHHMKSSHGVES